jgi:hypothetical protein
MPTGQSVANYFFDCSFPQVLWLEAKQSGLDQCLVPVLYTSLGSACPPSLLTTRCCYVVSCSNTSYEKVVSVVAEVSWLFQGLCSFLPSPELLHSSVDSIHLLL